MKKIINKKNNNPLFRNEEGKICFFNNRSKYFNKIKNWGIGTDIPDHYFVVVKENERFNIVDLDESKILSNVDDIVDDPVEEILNWEIFEGEEEVETEYEPVVVYRKCIKYKTPVYDFVSGLSVDEGKIVSGWIKTDRVKEEEEELSYPVKYKFSKVREYFNSQFKTVEVGSWDFKQLHIPSGLIISDNSFRIADPGSYTSFVYDKNQKSVVLGGSKEDVIEYDRYLDSLKYKKVIHYAPAEIQKEFEDNKDELYKKAGAIKKWDGPRGGQKWYINKYVSESEDGYRSERTISVEATDDLIFSRVYPEEYEKAKVAKEKEETSMIETLKSKLQEIVILDLEGANIIND